jgi:hypothetical protein
MAPGIRKLALTAHVTFSIGWMGAVAAFLALALVGLASPNEQMVRGVYLAMDLIGWWIIVPFCLASLLTGLIQSLGTEWGLFRHYWILMKLTVTVVLTILLMVHMQPTRRLAAVAIESAISGTNLLRSQMQLAEHAAEALVALIVVAALAIYKPRGMTRYGTRMVGETPGSNGPGRTPRWVLVFIVTGIFSLIGGMTIGGMALTGHGGRHGFGTHVGSASVPQTIGLDSSNRHSPIHAPMADRLLRELSSESARSAVATS